MSEIRVQTVALEAETSPHEFVSILLSNDIPYLIKTDGLLLILLAAMELDFMEATHCFPASDVEKELGNQLACMDFLSEWDKQISYRWVRPPTMELILLKSHWILNGIDPKTGRRISLCS